MSPFRASRASLLAFGHDLAWVAPAIVLAYAVRFNLVVEASQMARDLKYLVPAALLVHGTSFWLFGLYRGIWRFASIPDLVRILNAVAVGTAFTVLAAITLNRLQGVPRSVLVLYPVFLALGLAVPRLFYRWFKDRRLGLTRTNVARALVVGAGTAGELLVRDLRRRGEYLPVALLDDDGAKQGGEIHGVRIVGRIDDLPRVAGEMAVDLVLLAMPSAAHRVRQRVVALCNQAGLPCKTLPTLDDLGDASDIGGKLRALEIEDLLGRDPVVLDEREIRRFLQGKRVLVTGAGGSIGSELCRQIARFRPATLVGLDNGEYNLYRVDAEFARRNPSDGMTWTPLLGDVRDRPLVERLFAAHQPQVVFHAAAYKQVPLLETNEVQATDTNVFGTLNLAQAAAAQGASHFVMISTDKAVDPTNVMGATKRIAELVCRAVQADSSDTRMITTRFGNVLGSAGSVVPLFREQISAGGPVTVTDPGMSRYFMTIPEACRLVLQAGAMGEGGQVYVLQMGEPVRILDLAEQMIRLAGFVPYEDIAIDFIGLRPGEKLQETLFFPDETPVGTAHGKILLAAGTPLEKARVTSCTDQLRRACALGNAELLRRTLAQLVPSLPVGPAGTAVFDGATVVRLHPGGGD